MQAQIHTVAFRGIETIDVTVQIHLGNGLPAMTIVGLADKAVAESRERVRAALSSLDLALPPKTWRVLSLFALTRHMRDLPRIRFKIPSIPRHKSNFFPGLGIDLGASPLNR